MGKGKFDYDGYDLQLDVDVRGEIAGTRKGPNPSDAEVGCRNQNPWFPPLARALVGCWRAQVQGNRKVDMAFGGAVGGERPGERILVDTRRRHVKIVHRLTLPENAGKLAALKKLSETDEYRTQLKFTDADIPKDIDIGNISDSDWVQWLWWLRQLVNTGKLQIIRGESSLPTEDQIRRMGDITLSGGAYFGGKMEECWKLPKIVDKPAPQELQPAGTK